MTTGNFSSAQLIREEQALVLEEFDNEMAVELGQIGISFGRERKLPIAIEVRIGDWTVFKAEIGRAHV